MGYEPIIPYVQLDNLEIIPRDFFGGGFPAEPFSVKPFGTLVAIGVYTSAYLALRLGRRLEMNERHVLNFCFWIVIGAFIGGHVLDTLFYYPGRVLKDPLSLVRLWEGQSSFGGFIGCLGGALLWSRYYRQPLLPYADVIASTFPMGWAFGRAGCALAHDHPGVHTDLWIGVRYPDGGRFDLGLYEMLMMLPFIVAFLWLRARPRARGLYLAVLCIAYAPTRFALDFLRARDTLVADPRYWFLTPAQWASLALLGAGVWVALQFAIPNIIAGNYPREWSRVEPEEST